MGRKSKFPIEEWLKAIKGSGGIVATVAKKLDISWNGADRYIKTHPSLLVAMKDEEMKILDIATNNLYSEIQQGNVDVSKWVLSRKGKDRGWSERTELTGADGEQIQVVLYLPDNGRNDEKG